MFCQNCGKEVGEKDRFCPNCGVVLGYTRQEDEPIRQEPEQVSYTQPEPPVPQDFVSFQQHPEQKPDTQKKMVTWIIVGAVSVFGLIVLIILAVLVSASHRGAERQLDQWKDRQDSTYEYTDPFDNGFDFDDDDEEDDDFDFGDFGDDAFGGSFGGQSGTGEEHSF